MLTITSRGEGTSILGWVKDRRNKVFTLFLIFALFLFYWWYSNPLVVTITGSGEVSTTPQLATVSFIVASRSSNVNEAVNMVNNKQSTLKKALVSYGISDSDITESQINVIPPSLLNNATQDYGATITSTINLNDYKATSSLISFLYTNGASYVSQPILSVKDPGVLEDQVFDAALRDAEAKAKKVALKNWKIFKKRVVVNQVVSLPSSSATTSGELPSQNQELNKDKQLTTVTGEKIKASMLVSVTYKMW